MAIVHDFDYFRPKTIDEAISLLSKHQDSVPLAGGTDLVNEMKGDLRTPKALIDLKAIDELKKLEVNGDKLYVGAGVTFTELIESPAVRETFPLIVESAQTVASGSVRNRATLAGNICSAVPSMDSGPVVSVYEAEVVIKGPKGERRVKSDDWFKGVRKTDLASGELVTAVEFTAPANSAGCFVKLGRYVGEDLAQVNLAILALKGNEYRVAFGAVAPTPVRAAKIESILNGKPIDNAQIQKAVAVVGDEISPITDIRSSKEYRLHMAKVMVERGLKAVVERLDGKGPAIGTRLI